MPTGARTGVNVLGLNNSTASGHFASGKSWTVRQTGSTFVRSPRSPHDVLGSIRQGARITHNPTADIRLIDGWTWVQGSVTGTTAQMNGMAQVQYLVATSQITQDGTAATCRISDYGTVVRHTPGGASVGMIGRQATFRPSGFGVINAGGFTWHLGTIAGSAGASGHNGWNNRMMWVATTRLPDTDYCRARSPW